MAEESSTERSVKSVVICGVVTRMMTKAKKPISAAVTANIAISREAPRPFRKLNRLCKTNRPRDSAPKPRWAIIAYGMVSIWLTKVKGRPRNLQNEKNRLRRTRPIFVKFERFEDYCRYCWM